MTYNTARRRHFTTKQRIEFFEAHHGVCYLCCGKINGATEAWDIEHVIAREIMGDGADEDANLDLVHRKCHAAKTAADRKIIAKSNAVQTRFKGAKRSRNPMPGSRASGLRKRMDGTVERRGHPSDFTPAIFESEDS